MTIAEMKRDSAAHGKHTFERDTMKFWGAQILTNPDKYGIYLESIDNFSREKKIYCVKAYDKANGETVTFNDIGKEKFATRAEAESYADAIRAQIKGKFDHFEDAITIINIVYQDGTKQTIKED